LTQKSSLMDSKFRN